MPNHLINRTASALRTPAAGNRTRSPMRTQTALLFTLPFFASSAFAQTSDFVTAANQFLSEEVPKMELAVEAKDRAYFASGLERVKSFLDSQGPKLETSPPCAEAVSDFLIAGLCRISPPGTLCEPTTFIPRFDANLEKCRQAAKANQALQPTPVARRN